MKTKTFKRKQDIHNWCDVLNGELLNSSKGFSVPMCTIKTNKAYNELEITTFIENGKHLSNWYMWPLSLESLIKKIEFNETLILKVFRKSAINKALL